MIKYVVKYKITNNKKDFHEFVDYKSAKDIYLALAENVTIKGAKLYKIKNNKKQLIEKFYKKIILYKD